jgi:hypothetical protein
MAPGLKKQLTSEAMKHSCTAVVCMKALTAFIPLFNRVLKYSQQVNNTLHAR